MKLHPNAKTTPFARQLLVDRVRRLNWSMQDAAQAAGVSLRTGYRWLARERNEGAAGLQDRSSRARRIPHRTGARRTDRIERLRRRRLPAAQIADRLAMPRSTVAAVLARRGLERLSRLTPKPASVPHLARSAQHVEVIAIGKDWAAAPEDPVGGPREPSTDRLHALRPSMRRPTPVKPFSDLLFLPPWRLRLRSRRLRPDPCFHSHSVPRVSCGVQVGVRRGRALQSTDRARSSST